MSELKGPTALPGRTELDPVAILQALGVRRPASIAPVSGGFDARIWRLEYAGHCFALRVLRPEQHGTAQREVAALQAAHQAGLPVPELHTYGSWHEHPALLLGWCAGQPLWAVLGQQPWRVRSLGLAFGRAQAHMHRIAAPPGLSESWIAWAGDDRQLAERLTREQRSPPALIHLDYHPLNVLVDHDRVGCILDWANARAGDPRADIARTYSILRVEPFGSGSPLLELGRRLLSLFWLRGYREVAGPVDQSALFRAWAGAVMQRDLAHRVGQPDSWWRPEHLERIRHWTERQRRAAGL